MTALKLFLFAMMIAAIPASAAGGNRSDVNSIIACLDLTSFPNSTSPRRVAGKFTFADYGFTRVEKTETGVNLTRSDGGWMMSIDIVSSDPDGITICLRDRGLRKVGDIRTPSYDATSSLRVTRLPEGAWPARQVDGRFSTCPNDPPA